VGPHPHNGWRSHRRRGRGRHGPGRRRRCPIPAPPIDGVPGVVRDPVASRSLIAGTSGAAAPARAGCTHPPCGAVRSWSNGRERYPVYRPARSRRPWRRASAADAFIQERGSRRLRQRPPQGRGPAGACIASAERHEGRALGAPAVAVFLSGLCRPRVFPLARWKRLLSTTKGLRRCPCLRLAPERLVPAFVHAGTADARSLPS